MLTLQSFGGPKLGSDEMMEDTDWTDGDSQAPPNRDHGIRDASNDDKVPDSNLSDPPTEAMNAVRLEEEHTGAPTDIVGKEVDSNATNAVEEIISAKKDTVPPFPKDLLDESVVHLIEKAKGSAGKLVNLLAKHFPSIRDETRFDGRKVRLMKRAQIFVGDLWAAMNGKGYGAFEDIDHLTMFAGESEIMMLKASNFCLLFSRGARS